MARPLKRSVPDGATDSPSSKRVRQEEDGAHDEYPASIVGSVAESTFTTSSSKRPKKYLCDFDGCGKAFDRPTKLEIHTRTHTNERPFVCEVEDCDKTFQRKEHLNRHVKDKHSDERPHVCTYVDPTEGDDAGQCSKSFHTAAKLKRHIAAHEEKEQTRCSEPGCGKYFRKQETLQRHIRQDHLGEKGYRCTHTDEDTEEECGQMFDTVGQLKGHTKKEHTSTVVRYLCDICRAVQVQLPEKELPPESDLTSSVSDNGEVGFTSYTDLQAHIKTAHPPTCPDCGKQCASNKALKAHRDIEHSSLPERQQYKCTRPGCGRGFTKSGNLKVHVQNVHVKAKNFVCGIFDLSQSKKTAGWNGQGCGFALGTKANLEEHVRTQHLGIPQKIAPSVLKRLRAQARSPSDSLSSMETDEVVTPADGHVLTMLTGVGYEKARPVACMVNTCPQRFRTDYELSQHLELTHEWQVDDVNDALAEREALSGGKFWIGGGDEEEEAMPPTEAEVDEQLRMRLQHALSMDTLASHRPVKPSVREEWDAMNEMHDDMAIDPMLSNA